MPDLVPAPLHADAGPDACAKTVTATAQAFWIRARDGVRLRVGLWMPATPRATLLLFTGRTEFIEKYRHVAAHFAQAGLAVLVVDWRGQGASDRLLPDRKVGHVDDFASYQLDVAAMTDAALALNLPRPWHLLAHSMGGTIALRALHHGLQVRTASFSAPMWGIAVGALPDWLGQPLARALATMADAAGLSRKPLPGASFDVSGPPAQDRAARDRAFARNPLTSDRGEWDRMMALYAALPQMTIGPPSFGWARAGFAQCRALARLPSPDLPALISVSSGETLVSRNAIRIRANRWAGARLLELSGAKHEVLFERPALRNTMLAAIEALIKAH